MEQDSKAESQLIDSCHPIIGSAWTGTLMKESPGIILVKAVDLKIIKYLLELSKHVNVYMGLKWLGSDLLKFSVTLMEYICIYIV